MTTPVRLVARAGAAALAAAAWAALVVPASPAFAHNSVIDEGPKAESTISAQPGEVWIETNDALLELDGATAMDVLGPDGRHYATACPAVDGAIASAPAELGPAGEYTVAWRVVSADGHPITGDFTFEWEPAAGEPVAEGAAEAVCAAASGADDAPAGPDDSAGEVDDGAEAAASADGADLVWIAVAVVAVIGAGIAAFALTRRRPQSGAEPSETAAETPPDAASGAESRDDDR